MTELIKLFLVDKANPSWIFEVFFKKDILLDYTFPVYISFEEARKFIHNDAGPAVIIYQLKPPAFQEYKTNLFGSLEELNLNNCFGKIIEEHYYFNNSYIGKNLNAYSKKDIIPHLNKLILS